jgi:hypothetical protein
LETPKGEEKERDVAGGERVLLSRKKKRREERRKRGEVGVTRDKPKGAAAENT